MSLLDYPVSNPFRSHVPAGFYDPTKGHTGVDFLMKIGTDLSLAFSTTVRAFYSQKEMGNTLYLEDGVGNILVFAHLSENLVSVGQVLQPGTVFAKSGATGTKITAPHLHFEIIAPKPMMGHENMTRRLGAFTGYNIDPLSYLNTPLTPHWAEDALEWARANGLLLENHELNNPVTWGELLTLLKRYSDRS